MDYFFCISYHVPQMVKKRLTSGQRRGSRFMRQPPRENGALCQVAMKTQGEIEAAICEGVSRFEQDYMGRGPKDIHAHLIGDLLVVRLKGVLTAAEQQLVQTLPAEKGRDLLKQVRTHLIETARSVMESMVEETTDVKVLSLHHDISTVTGEEIVLFTLARPPLFRETKKKADSPNRDSQRNRS
jgi:uncharacterized protein YbcI